MNQQEEVGVFPVDLDRGEYVRFNTRMAKERGLYRFRGIILAAFGFSLAMAATVLIVDAIKGRPFDASLFTLCVFVVLAWLTVTLGVPNYIRIRAGRAYDRALLSNMEFYGVVRVYPDRVEKTVGYRTVTLPLDARCAYVEYEDMQVLLSTVAPAIILPARCVTEEDATYFRETALTVVPKSNCRIYARVVSRTAERLPFPAEAAKPVEDEKLLTVAVNYTAQEFVAMLTRSAVNVFIQRLPLFACVAVIVALALGLSSGPFVLAGLFLGTLALLFFVNVGVPRWRARVQAGALADKALFLTLTLSEQGVALSGAERRPVFYPWIAIRHVTEQAERFEFHLYGGLFEVPARCVTDPEQLRDIVNSHLHRNL